MRKDKQNDRKLIEYMKTASFNSWKDRNNDGEGCLYFSGYNKLYAKRSLKKLKYNEINNTWFLCSHQRLATIGDGKKNSHPHTSRDFICFHNGVFSGIGNKKQSDTKVYLKELQRNYTTCNGDIEKALNKTHDKIDGSYSVILVHKRTRDVFYYKDYYTYLYYIENRKYLIMSTLKENIEYAKYLFNIKSEIKEAKESLIYELIHNDFKPIGQILSDTTLKTRYNKVTYVRTDTESDKEKKETKRIKENHYLYDDYFKDRRVSHFAGGGVIDTGFNTWADSQKKHNGVKRPEEKELICNRIDLHEEEQ